MGELLLLSGAAIVWVGLGLGLWFSFIGWELILVMVIYAGFSLMLFGFVAQGPFY